MPSDWTTPQKSFDDVTLDSFTHIAGDTIDYHGIMTDHVIQTIVTASAGDEWFVELEGSLDGVNWADLQTLTVSGPAVTLAVVELKPVRYVRTYGDNRGSGSPNVTTWIASR
jgi:hypothetical protein